VNRLPDADIKAVKVLLGKGLPHRRIAEITGVDRGTVGNIASNKGAYVLPTFGKLQPPVPSEGGLTDMCPTCGRTVTVPCLACFLERHPAKLQPNNTVEITGMIGYICKHIALGYLTVTGHWSIEGDGLKVFQTKRLALNALNKEPGTAVVRLASFTEGDTVYTNITGLEEIHDEK
jgi:hypothetical protein